MPEYFWPIITGIIALGVLFAGILPRIKTERAKGVIDLQAAEIDAYKQAIGAQEKRFQDRLDEMQRRHSREIGELSGRINSMTPEFAATLASLVAPTLAELLKDAAA